MTQYVVNVPEVGPSAAGTTRPRLASFQDARWRNWPAQAVLMALAFFAALFVRAPGLLLAPRFWAEEGNAYYAALQDPAVSPLTLVVGGNYQLLINIAAAAASAVPAHWAAHVTTAVAAAVALVEIGLLALVGAQQRWHPICSMLLAVAIALLPHGYELYLTSTNVQWLCSATILALCLARLDGYPPVGRLLAGLWTLACGLTGVPSIMLMPIALAVGWSRKSRTHLMIAAILAVCAVVQFAVIASHPLEGRQFGLDPFVIVMAPVLQSMVMPLAGSELAAPILFEIRQPGGAAYFLVTLFGAGLLLAAAVRSLLRTPGGGVLAGTLFGTAALTSALNVIGARGAAESLVSLSEGARYFYLATICWLLLAMCLLHRAGTASRGLAALAICLCIVAGISDLGNRRWTMFVEPAQPWRTIVDACHDQRPCRVKVWPGWGNWAFQLVRP